MHRKMSTVNVQLLVSLILTAQLSLGMAASPVIGVVLANGSFRIDSSTIHGNGTLTDGAAIETSKASSDIQLQGGVRMRLASDTRGKVFHDRLVLERGVGQLENAAGYRVEALSLRVIPSTPAAVGRVQMKAGNRVYVAALQGDFRVTNSQGTLIAALAAGRALEFEPQAGAAAPSTLTGCLEKREGRYFLTDETAGVTVELKGTVPDKEVGNRVEITGSTIPGATPAAGASQVLQVGNVKHLSKRCTSAAGAAAAGGAAVGMTVGTKAVIAGVIVASAATGTAVGLTRGDEESVNVSRP